MTSRVSTMAGKRATLMVCLAVLAAAVYTVGCGGEMDTTTRGTQLSFAESSDGPEQAEGRTVDSAHCDTAAVGLRDNRGTIGFQARCAGSRSGGSVHFVVERYLPSSPVRMRGPRHYSEPLKVRDGSGEFHRGGSCRAQRRIIQCQAQVSGSVILAGNFDVRKRSSCSLAVSVIEIKIEPCDPGGCQGPVRARELFDGRPTGC